MHYRASCSALFLPLLAVCLPPATAGTTYAKLPLSFESNQGQTDASVKFLARASGYTLFVTEDEAVFAGRDGSVERMKLIGANRKARVELLDKQPGISNYFIGNDPSKWRTNVSNYGRVALRGVYPGIDLIFYGNERQLEYDWVVAPGADPKLTRVTWEGTSHPTKNANGDLVLNASLVQHKPVILQEGKRIEGGYVVRGHEVAFELAKYDTTKPLVIDPVLVYSTYLGGSGSEAGSGIAVDGSGNAYVTGFTMSIDFPITNPIQGIKGDLGGGTDAFVTKINAAGSARVYSTYLGGNQADVGYGIAVDSGGNAYVAGTTSSTNFPTFIPIQASNGGGKFSFDAFVTKINAAGSALVYSTYLGGTNDDYGYGLAVDGLGNAYVTGTTTSTDFPTANAIQASNGGGGADAFVTKINAAGSALVYSTYLGGNGWDEGFGIAVDGSGNAHVTGYTLSPDFPTVNPLQANLGGLDGNEDVFVTKINAAGSALVYSTYLGGKNDDEGHGVAIDGLGNVYVTGYTTSPDFPTANAIQSSNGGGGGFNEDVFVTKINAAGSTLVYSTYLGGSGTDYGSGIAADGSGNAYVTGFTTSIDFPTADPIQASNGGGGFSSDAFVTEINAAGTVLVYSTYLGGSGGDAGNGIAVDGLGNTYVTGSTRSFDFPTANPLQASMRSLQNAFVTKFPAVLEPQWQQAITTMKTAAGTDSLSFWEWAWYWQRSPAFSGAPAGFGVFGSIDNTPGTIDKIISIGGGNGLSFVSAEQWVLDYRQALQPPDPWQEAITAMKTAAGTDSQDFWQWAWYWQRSPAFSGAPAGFGVLGSIDNVTGLIAKIIAKEGGTGFDVVSAEQWMLFYRQAISQ